MEFPLYEMIDFNEDIREEFEMLWVSIHETIDGAKLRSLYKLLGCSKYEATGVLTLLWLWGLTNAERSGKIPYADKDDVADVVGRNIAGSKLTPMQIVDGLIKTNWLEEREDGIYLHDWEQWQAPFYAYKDRTERSAEAMRVKRDRDAEEKGVPIKHRKAVEYTDDFERIWNKYPRKADKGMGFAKYKERLAEGHSIEDLEVAVENYAEECRRAHTEEKYIKHMSTFFSDKKPFEEYLEKEKESEKYSSDYDPFEEV